MFHRFNWHAIQVFVVSYIAYVALNVAWFSVLMKNFYLEKFAGVLNASDIELGTYFKIFSNPHLLILLAWVLVVKGMIWYALPYSKGSYQWAFISGAVYGLVVSGSHQILSFALVANWPIEALYYGVPWMMFACAVVTVAALYTAEKCGCLYMCGCGGKTNQ
jgi:uncharacterized membrane protein